MKKIISVLSSLIVPLLFVFFSKTDLSYCEGYIDNFDFPKEWFSSDINSSTYKSYLSSLLENPVFSHFDDDCLISLHAQSSSSLDVLIVQPDFLYGTVSSSSSYVLAYGKYCFSTLPISELSTFPFTIHSGDLSVHESNSIVYQENKSSSSTSYSYGYSYFYSPSYPVLSSGYRSDAVFFHKKPPYNPVIAPLYEAVYSLNIEKEKFIEWLINNGRYVEIFSELTENRVSGFVDIFQRYGANSNAFSFNIKQFFQYLGIGQTISDYNAILNKTQSLYREYQLYIRQLLIDQYNDRTHNTSNIKPDTNSDNTALITNSDDDTIIIRILRDILRSLISLPHNISNLLNSLEVKLDGLENTVNVVNDSGLPDFSELWSYSESDFDDDLYNFANDVSEVQQLPLNYLTDINNNALMPENMLADKENLTVNIPNISGFSVSDDGKSFSTQTTSYVVSSADYPWLDPLVKKIKRFSGILLILGYLVHLRFKLPDIVRGE